MQNHNIIYHKHSTVYPYSADCTYVRFLYSRSSYTIFSDHTSFFVRCEQNSTCSNVSSVLYILK
ncbi:hypothetical protein FKM82_021930 [Ascaphus truei]